MKKTGRLDQILVRLGYCDEEQIKRALRRQKTQGGRLGQNLLALGAISEEQLLNALAEQYRIPTLLPEERNLRPDLVGMMPQDVVAEGLMLPLSWNEVAKVLSVATSNPGDLETLRRVKDAFEADTVRIALAPDALLRALGAKLVPRADASGKKRIVLPELFAHDPAQGSGEVPTDEASGPPRGRVLMVTSATSRKTLLPPVFQREGYELTVVGSQWEAADALKSRAFDRVIVSQELAEPFSQWVRSETFPAVEPEVVVFPSVTGALLENPISYQSTANSLRSAVQALADARAALAGASPAYGRIAADVDALAELVGLRRVARDGMNLAVHLLLPGHPTTAAVNGTPAMEPFAAFASSLELAARLRFRWKLEPMLATCHALFTGRQPLTSPDERTEETLLAAQVVALTWFRHNQIEETRGGTPEERTIAVRTALRGQSGRLATASLVDTYLRLLAERGVSDESGDSQVMLIGRSRIAEALAPALQRVGREPLPAADPMEAVMLADRRAPAAVVIDHNDFPAQIEKFSRVSRLGAASLLFVLTDSADPSLLLALLDAGVDDVFCPPHDFDLVAARIHRAIRSRSRERSAGPPRSGQFSARLEAFSLVELIRLLTQGLKTVRIDLSRGSNSDRGVIYMHKGRLIHASTGELRGEPAVFRVLAWETDGEFTVCEESHFPQPTIHSPVETVLTEGLKLVDVMRE